MVGRMPVPEAARRLGMARTSVYYHIRQMERRGYQVPRFEQVGLFPVRYGQLLALLAAGWKLDAISREIGLTKRGCFQALRVMRRVYRAKNNYQLVAWAVGQGIVTCSGVVLDDTKLLRPGFTARR